MPAKLESYVKQVMSEGKSKERAFAICTAALKSADAGLITDAPSTFKAIVDKTTGFLTAPVNLARIGVQYYYGFELGLEDRALEKIGVFRSPEEVFNKDSVKSFVNLVITNDHPTAFVTVDNVKKLQVGQVSDIEFDELLLSGVATITDKDIIDKITSGKKEVSVGYANDLKEEQGVYKNDSYEYIQTNIRANHLAIVDAGRCGSACKLTVDNKESLVKITIDGIEYETENTQLGQAILNQQKKHDAEMEELEKKKKEADEEKEEMKKEKEKAEAQKDAAIADTLDSDALNVLISDRSLLLVDARSILGDKMPECTDCPKEIKMAVVDHVFPDLDLKDKSEDYISASYDMAVVKSKKAKGTLDNLGDDFKTQSKDNKKTEAKRDSARDKYMKDHLGLDTVEVK